MVRWGATTVWLMLAATAGSAAELTLDTAYGNQQGCAYLQSGVLDSDELVYLTRRELGKYASGCEFVAVQADSHGNQRAQGICHYEGEEVLGAEDFVITPPDAAGLVRVFAANAEIWAELEPCS